MADKRRRKSLKIFQSRSSTPAFRQASSAPSNSVDTPSPETYLEPDHSEKVVDLDEFKSRPRVLQRLQRTSVFDSLRSLQSLEEDEKILIRSDSKTSSIHDDINESPVKGRFGNRVCRCAEVQIPAGNPVFKKRSHFVVLTESHLIRFKTQQKAAEMFPIIPSVAARGNLPRSSTGSFGSYSEMYNSNYTDVTQGVPLHQVVAVYRLDDGRPYFSVEIAYLDEVTRKAAAMQLSFGEPHEATSWIDAIRAVVADVKKTKHHAPTQQLLDYVLRMLGSDRDYASNHPHIFNVVQRSASRSWGRGSSDDLTKIGTTLQYLVIGTHKMHLLPIPRSSGRSSSISLVDPETPTSYGIMSLSSLQVGTEDDCFQLCFQTPIKQPHVLSLASDEAVQIALWLRFASEYLRPQWTVQPFIFRVPQGVEDQMDPPESTPEENGYFERTLLAFSAAFDVDPTHIYYSVDYECEDSPCFRLLPPLNGYAYSSMELLAVLRSLRYNETFTTISLAGIDLRPLCNLYDIRGAKDDVLSTRSGIVVQIPGQADLSVFQQEIRALALKSRRLRRLDFTNALFAHHDSSSAATSCGVPEALTPLCKRALTNVDWVVLNGVGLSETDLDFLVDSASERQCHLRALEIAESGLSVQNIDVLLSTLSVHESTLEVINIAGAQGRFSPELFHRSMGYFSRLRRLNLTRVQKTAGSEPLLTPELLFEWKLESLHLNQSTLNEQSIDCISAYLASPKSDHLRELWMDQCGLTGRDLAVILQSMMRVPGEVRHLFISANENRLGMNSSLLSKCIAQNCAPSSLSMRMMDFEKEQHFRDLVTAVSQNRTIRSLDISQASLPYDAGTETCEALKQMFAANDTLEELDISGEVSHLDTARFGIGLNLALLGLARNKTLRLLRIEHQKLGMQGANTLAEVIEHNQTLLEIHCEHNDVNLQSFTILVNALSKNENLLYLPDFAYDKERFMIRFKEEFEVAEPPETATSPKPGALRKSINALSHVSRHHRQSSSTSGRTRPSFTARDMNLTIAALGEQWLAQTERLQQYLSRNFQLTRNLAASRDEDRNYSRMPSIDSLDKILDKMSVGPSSYEE